MVCTLCTAKTTEFSIVKGKTYYHCSNCDGIMLPEACFLSKDEEKKRYDTHNNDITDPDYQNFVSPIVDSIVIDYNKNHKGLDFGSGSGPVITEMLRNQEYDIQTYDPFFDPNPQVLHTTYNYIACCEVMEHFFNPKKEFKLLYSLLKRGGRLYCKTNLYDKSIDFDFWWYKNDPTHVFFYTKKTLIWIKEYFNFNELIVSKKLITFKK
ncbi:class I SAM-dependent methyltransferase [Aquimarina sp. SS2-1]|uniref:class I SAM-dependent methyltransferase n=1 Tax=Aquimarina besae TaxID=3342247 RepID=UPI00366B983B